MPAESADGSAQSRRGVYGISVAAELSGFGIQALRLYEQYGLVTPTRTGGGTRRYSEYDLARLGRIAELIDAGVNLVGIGRVLDLESRTGELERDKRRLEAVNARLRAERSSAVNDPFDIAPEADRLEQDLPADPAAAPLRPGDTGEVPWDTPEADRLEQIHPLTSADDPLTAAASGERAWDAPEGDLLEQTTTVSFEDDDRDNHADRGFDDEQQ